MRKLLAIAATVSGLPAPRRPPTITGAGATFPFPIYAKWAEAYKKETGVGLNYQSIGSTIAAAIRQIRAKTVAFGATDAPLKGEDLQKNGLIQFPTVMGGVVPAINIAGVEPGKLKLTGPILAEIYLGTIKKWNDPKITALNPGVTLPDANISPVLPSDGSGTTFVFTDYLSKVSPTSARSSAPTPRSSGPSASAARATRASRPRSSSRQLDRLCRVRLRQANKLSYALVQNADGQFPGSGRCLLPGRRRERPTGNEQPGFGISLNNQKGAQAWPITAATFLLVHAKPDKPEQVQATLKFVDWAFRNGDAMALDLDYCRCRHVKDQVRAAWKGVTDPSGKPIF